MKTLALTLILSLGMGIAHAADSTMEKAGENAAATGRDVKRAAKKGVHRVQEKMCNEGDAKCLAKKAGNRVEEGVDYTKDKAKEVKDKVD